MGRDIILLRVLSHRLVERRKSNPLRRMYNPFLVITGGRITVDRLREICQSLPASIRNPDWARLGRTMHAMAANSDYQRALAEADRLCEL
jgi:hypothetical protein